MLTVVWTGAKLDPLGMSDSYRLNSCAPSQLNLGDKIVLRLDSEPLVPTA
jgi:hypothetical protein